MVAPIISGFPNQHIEESSSHKSKKKGLVAEKPPQAFLNKIKLRNTANIEGEQDESVNRRMLIWNTGLRREK
jgi:hypothetical protein